MSTKSANILSKVWLDGSSMYQQRIPAPDQAGIRQTVDAIFAPGNKMCYNEFMDQLINRVGMSYVKANEWQNPLAVFKGSNLDFGSSIQEIYPKWVRAHSYEDDAETLLKMHRPEVQAAYHSVNSKRVYPITINQVETKAACLDPNGLTSLVSALMTSPVNSDRYDEYTIMKNLIGEYESELGFYKHKLSAAPTDEATCKEFLQAVREYVMKFKFPSTQYNAAVIKDIPVFEQDINNLILLIGPGPLAACTVQAFASAFNVSELEIQPRIVVIDEWPFPDGVALLTTKDFFVCCDQVYQNESHWNPETLGTNFFLHHWAVYSVSPFVPCVLFTTAEGTTNPTTTMEYTALNIAAADDTAKPGDVVALTLTANGTFDGDDTNLEIAPDAATFTLSATRVVGDDDEAETVSVPLNSRTYVDRLFKLHIQKTGLKAGDVIKVDALTTYVNPSTGEKGDQTDSVEITIA